MGGILALSGLSPCKPIATALHGMLGFPKRRISCCTAGLALDDDSGDRALGEPRKFPIDGIRDLSGGWPLQSGSDPASISNLVHDLTCASDLRSGFAPRRGTHAA